MHTPMIWFFLVGAFLEKSVVPVVRPELTLYVPLFSTDFNRFREPSGHGFESLFQPETFTCICEAERAQFYFLKFKKL